MAAYSIGVDLGGTKIAALLADDALNLVAREQVQVDPARKIEKVMDQVCELALSMQKKVPSGSNLVGLGLSFPGLLDLERNVMVYSENLDWRNVPVGTLIQGKIDVPFYLEHDVRSGAIAEVFYGAGREYRDILYLSVGTGISGTLIWKRNIIRGAHGISAEIGHTVCQFEGPPCRCGLNGCLEALASGSALEREAYHLVRRPVSGREVIERAQRKEEPYQMIVRRAAVYLGVGCANVVKVFDPQVVILGGGVMEAEEYLLPLVEPVYKANHSGAPVMPQLIPGRFKSMASVAGAAALPFLKKGGLL